jgi:hypothetical protein
MKRLLLAISLLFALPSIAAAQRQTFVSESKTVYDAIMIDWIRTGNTALGSWTRIGVNEDYQYTQTRVSITASFSKAAVSLVVAGTIINGRISGKNVVLSLEAENGGLYDEVFQATTVTAFNSIISRYRKFSSAKLAQVERENEERYKREDLARRYADLEDNIASYYESAKANYGSVRQFSLSQEAYESLFPSDFSGQQPPNFIAGLDEMRKQIMETNDLLERYPTYGLTQQCQNKTKLETQLITLKDLKLTLTTYRDHMVTGKEFINGKFDTILESLRVALGLQTSLEASIKANKATFYKTKYTSKEISDLRSTILKGQQTLTDRFLIFVDGSRKQVMSIADDYIRRHADFLSSLSCP